MEGFIQYNRFARGRKLTIGPNSVGVLLKHKVVRDGFEVLVRSWNIMSLDGYRPATGSAQVLHS